MAKNYDLVILGGGTGGYVAAIKAAQLGRTVAIIEKEKLGGTCLHKGCIPTKALLKSAELFHQTKSAAEFGIECSEVKLNFMRVQKRKQNVVDQLYQGVQHLMKKNKIDVYHGYGRIMGPSIFSPNAGSVSFYPEDNDLEQEVIVGQNVMIATGSHPTKLPGLPFDGERVMNSDQALELKKLPKSISIIGGGVIGVEWASLLNDFGVKVTLIEADNQLLPGMDHDISRKLAEMLKKKGIQIFTNTSVLTETIKKDNGISFSLDCSTGESQLIKVDQLLVAVGRKANTDAIGIENTEIELDDKGFIVVNEHLQTKEKHIYAVGDVIGGKQLAHVASYEGKYAVEHLSGEKNKKMCKTLVPSCVYSQPEVATVGLSEQEAMSEGYQIKIGKMPFQGIGKAHIGGSPDGFVKIIANKENDDILGVHMIGPHATELISEVTLAKVLDATSWEIGETIHPHPSLSEAVYEAALAVDNEKIHG